MNENGLTFVLENKKCSIVIRRLYLRISFGKRLRLSLLNLYNLQFEIINFLYMNLRKAKCYRQCSGDSGNFANEEEIIEAGDHNERNRIKLNGYYFRFT